MWAYDFPHLPASSNLLQNSQKIPQCNQGTHSVADSFRKTGWLTWTISARQEPKKDKHTSLAKTLGLPLSKSCKWSMEKQFGKLHYCCLVLRYYWQKWDQMKFPVDKFSLLSRVWWANYTCNGLTKNRLLFRRSVTMPGRSHQHTMSSQSHGTQQAERALWV